MTLLLIGYAMVAFFAFRVFNQRPKGTQKERPANKWVDSRKVTNAKQIIASDTL